MKEKRTYQEIIRDIFKFAMTKDEVNTLSDLISELEDYHKTLYMKLLGDSFKKHGVNDRDAITSPIIKVDIK